MELNQVPKSKQSLPSRGISSSYQIWLQQKKEQDSTLWEFNKSFWVIQGKVYDLTEFISKHPGGAHWLQYTMGQNITEHYITHHLNIDKTNAILQKYELKNQHSLSLSSLPDRFSFQQKGLYQQVKKRLLKKYTPFELQNTTKTKFIGLVFFFIWLLTLTITGFYQSYIFALISGYLIYPVVGVAHNFVHMKNSLFKYFYLVTGFTPKEWEIMHCLSHHQYTNTLLDYELQAYEPFVYFLQIMPQNTILKLLIAELIYFFTIPANIILKIAIVPLMSWTKPQWFYLVPLSQIAVLYLLNQNLIQSIKLFLIMQCFFGYLFTKITFGGHRVQTMWTEGKHEIKDFGEHSFYTCNDIYPELGGGFLSFLIMSGFNIHTAHHMFPTIDNQHLEKVHKILIQLCSERKFEKCQYTIFSAIKSVYKNCIFLKQQRKKQDKIV